MHEIIKLRDASFKQVGGKLKFHNFVNSDICDGLDYWDSGLCVADL